MQIGIDIGGTNIRLGVVTHEGKILARKKIAVGSKKSPEEIIALLESLVKSIGRKETVKAVGLGVPGIVSAREGIVYSSPHYPLWKNFSLARRLSRKLKMPVVMDNDANMIARGELWKGAGKNWKHFLMITLGTGIGGALVTNGEMFTGTRGFAGEMGHMNVEPDGLPCGCGSKGCWETIVSGSGTKNFDTFARYLGIGLASLVNVTGIEKIVLGGGVMGSADLFLEKAKAELKNRIYAKTFEGIEIVPAELGDDAGILGSARMAFRRL